MKRINKITLSLAVVMSSMLYSGCNNVGVSDNKVVKPTITSEQLSYRNTALNETHGTPKSEFSKDGAGSSKKIARAFQDAPPMIPHDTTGMLPIQKDNNQCITCHVDSAPYDKTIPAVPISHMTDFRPHTAIANDGSVLKNGHKIKNSSSEELKNVSIKKTGGTLYQGRFNCSQCHAPQSNAKLITPNNFEADFTSKDGAYKSSWDDTKFMEDIDTRK
jgi:cytochrome c-type protein NapB